MIWVTADDVILIHSRIIQTTGGIEGLRDRAGLEAAIAAPLQSFGGEDLFPSDIEKIARIGFGLASNHAFLDGNKRIGAMMTQHVYLPLSLFQVDFLIISDASIRVNNRVCRMTPTTLKGTYIFGPYKTSPDQRADRG